MSWDLSRGAPFLSQPPFFPGLWLVLCSFYPLMC